MTHRELVWSFAMTRQTLTFDNYFNESILDQGTGYRYGSCSFCGFQGAARDPLQHVRDTATAACTPPSAPSAAKPEKHSRVI
jgi:hypothetical protein